MRSNQLSYPANTQLLMFPNLTKDDNHQKRMQRYSFILNLANFSLKEKKKKQDSFNH
jgi:hypothetical protein